VFIDKAAIPVVATHLELIYVKDGTFVVATHLAVGLLIGRTSHTSRVGEVIPEYSENACY
jgi:hypothetical protein